MTLDQTGGVLAGGTMTVDGIPIVIPANTLATLPAITVAWSELFNGQTPAIPNGYMAHVSFVPEC
jgi:hypothetical protein